MDGPPGKTIVRLADGRNILVASQDAARYEYFSEGGKVMRRLKEAAPGAPPQARGPSPPKPPAVATAPPPSQGAPPPPSSAPKPYVPPAPPPRPVAPPPPPPAPRPVYAPRAPPAGRAPPRRAVAAPRGPPRRAVMWPGPKLTYNMRAIIVASILVIMLITVPAFANLGHLISQFSPCTVNQHSYPRTADFNVTRGFQMSAPGGTVNYNLGLAVPYDLSGKQEIVQIVEAPPHSDQTSYPTWDKLWWNGSVAAGGSQTVSVRYQVHMSTYVWTMTDNDVGTLADIPQNLKDIYLDEEWKINPHSPTVQNLANKVTDTSKGLLQQIKDLYKYLLCPPYHYSVTQDFQPQTPEVTVDRQTGDCDDFSVLFISMARYLGIPAWLELGLLYDETQGKFGPHGWASVYLPLKAGGGEIVTIDVVNKLFLIRDTYHFGDWSSDGDAQHLQDYYTLLTYAPATSPPFQVAQSVTHDAFQTEGVVNYFSP